MSEQITTLSLEDKLSQSPTAQLAMGDEGNKKFKLPRYTMADTPDGVVMTVYLTDDIMAPIFYSEIVSWITQLTEKDTIYVYLHTPGGYVSSAQYIGHALRTAKAKTIGVAAGSVISAGTPIIAACQKVKVLPGASFMFHHSKGGISGKTLFIESNVKSSNKFVTSMLQDIRDKGFLTDEEFDRVNNRGQDVYVSGTDMIKRLADKEILVQ